MTPTADNFGLQIFWLLVLAIPVASLSRIVVFEEVFREAREYCERQSRQCRWLFQRKFFYVFTCEYCFSHYLAALFLAITRFQLLIPGWRGYLIALFALVFVANVYLNLYSRLRVDITSEKKTIEVKHQEAEARKRQVEQLDTERASADGDGH